jgi:hypothetical protein
MKRKTLDQLDLDLVFSLTHNGLLFGRISGEDIFSDHRIVSLLEDPAVQEYCGLPLVAEKIEKDETPRKTVWIKAETLDPKGSLLEGPTPIISHQLHIYAPNGETFRFFLSGREQQWFRDAESTRVLNSEDEYYGCTLPHKHVLGCNSCLNDGGNLPGCRIKNLRHRGLFHATSESPDTRQPGSRIVRLKSGEKAIGEFTYISARYTALEDKVFIEKTRQARHHFFRRIPARIAAIADINKESAEKAHKTRKKYRDVCPNCFVKEDCWNHAKDKSWDDRKWCKSTYPKTEKEATKDILNQVKIPYTNKELRFLMLATGPLENRYNRSKVAGTFYVDKDTLHYGLIAIKQVRQRARPLVLKNPIKYLKECQGIEDPPKGLLSVTQNLKACLIVAASTYKSPGYGEWGGHIRRRIIYTKVSTHGVIGLHFVGAGRSTLRYSFGFKDLSRYYGYYRRMPFLNN